MKIQKTIWVEDYVLEFYTRISDSMGDRTPEELMAMQGKYYRLVQIQTMSDKIKQDKEKERFE